MTADQAVSKSTAAQDYWNRHYTGEFRFGEGTETILTVLAALPPVRRWGDLGSGTEAMLWAIALQPTHLTAVDIDTKRLEILRQFTRTAAPRPVHTTALRLCGRGIADFTDRCGALTDCVQADCLTGSLSRHPSLAVGGFDLVTQFGLLGLCSSAQHFTDAFTDIHRLLAPGGAVAGANWVACNNTGRVALTAALYRDAAAQAGVELTVLSRVESADPDFPAVWIYAGHHRR